MIDPDIRDDSAHAAVPDRTVRQFAVLLALVLGALAVRDVLARGVTTWALLLAITAVVVFASRARPAADYPADFHRRDAADDAHPHHRLGRAASRDVYGIFTPMALVFRLIGRDALARRRVNAQTYWAPKAAPTDVKSYFRQS